MPFLRKYPTSPIYRLLPSPLTDPLAMLRESPTPLAGTSTSIGHSRGDEPGRIEPAVGLVVIGQPRNVPVADIGRISLPNRGPASDIDHAVGKPGEHLVRVVR